MTSVLTHRPRWTDVFVTRPIVSVVLSLALLLDGRSRGYQAAGHSISRHQSSSLEISHSVSRGQRRDREGLCRGAH